jgi:hypothetical protein
MRKIMYETKRTYDIHSARLRPNLVKQLDEEKTWASRSHQPDDQNGYQWDMSEVDDWQYDAFAAAGFDDIKIDQFLDWLDYDEHWHQPPVLHSEEVKQREVPYLANGELIPAIAPTPVIDDRAVIVDGNITEIRLPGPHPNITVDLTNVPAENIVDGSDHKHVDHSPAFPCKRGDNDKGWYQGLPPCRNKVDKANRFCPACHKVYMLAKKGKA